MKVYELISKLEKLPSGTEVRCFSVKSLDNLADKIIKKNFSYLIDEPIVDTAFQDNVFFLQF